MYFQTFCRQTWALVKKNLIIVCVRSWLSTFIRGYVIPIALITLLLNIPNFAKDTNAYGFGNVFPVQDLADTIGNKKLVLVREKGLSLDLQHVLDTITKPLDATKLVYLNSTDEVEETCPVDFHGNSPCHAVVIFQDSPLSGSSNASWRYTIRTDPSLSGSGFNVFDDAGAVDRVYLPLQVAIENAMTNSTEIPEALKYTFAGTQADADEAARKLFQTATLYILSCVFFFSMIPIAQQVSAMVARDRETGMSQLIDSMAGGAAWPRVVSYIVTFDLIYLPLWIILGCLFWSLLLPGINLGIVIFWQVFAGSAVISGSVFGATFFTKSQIASIAVSLVSIVLGVVAAMQENAQVPATLAEVIVLSLLFPPMAYVFFFNFMTKAAIIGVQVVLSQPLPADLLIEADFPGQEAGTLWAGISGPVFIWVFCIVQMFGFAALAVLAETLLHGNFRRHKHFDTEGADDRIAVRTTGLVKHYAPGLLWKVLCCCWRKPIVQAVDGLDLVSHKNQVLCLLGPNGSGKTTTLEMLAGFQKPTDGAVQMKILPTQLGICPQKNVLWNNLSVYEHLVIWNQLKGNVEDSKAIESLIDRCDLALKRNSLSKNLSGGMKRKLQLACMLVGGSSVCLLDEVTSGLDPLSRRVIWNVILAERPHRTIILTTHFLDEAEVLSDHIVILSLGNTKCQGTPAQLKNQYGGGYRVSLPKTVDVSRLDYPVIEEHDHYICTTPDSKTAVRVLSSFGGRDASQAYVTGPTIEDVFLRVSNEPYNQTRDASGDGLIHYDTGTLPGHAYASLGTQGYGLRNRKPSTRVMTFLTQVRALLIKRIIILRTQWWIYLLAIAIPVVVSRVIGNFIIGYETPECGALVGSDPPLHEFSQFLSPSGLALGPRAVNASVMDIVTPVMTRYNNTNTTTPVVVRDSRDDLLEYVSHNLPNVTTGAVWLGNNSAPLIAIPMDQETVPATAMALLNLAIRVRTGIDIIGATSSLMSYTAAESGTSMVWVTIFCLLQTLYPAFFSLYPTYERRTQVRALQYSNGIRPAPLLFAYLMFDFVFVLIISVLCTVMISTQAPWWGLGYIFFIMALYGLAATLLVYLISRMARSQPGAFGISFLVSLVMYIISVIGLVVVNKNDPGNQASADGLAYGLGLIFPVQNLFRAVELGLNSYIIRCRNTGMVTDSGSIYAYGGPILLLLLQIFGLFFLTMYIEGVNMSWFSAKVKTAISDDEKTASSGASDVEAETARVEASESDLLRVLHISKRFGTNHAVEDVSFGLRTGEIMALLGPNGAGKTTTINMIRGDMSPSSGHIYLKGVDTHADTRLAQENLGVCPQFDALDMLTVREHLVFYARCKGVPEIKAEVEQVMKLVGVTAHAGKLAAKLSGGNKRKLSLAIALLGNPPVLLLDEPSSAMDATSKRILWKTLEAVSPGRSVLVTTHSMEEADALCTRAAIVAKRMLAIGTSRELRQAYSNEYHVHLVLRSAPVSSHDEMAYVAQWVQNTFGRNVKWEGDNLGGQIRFIVPINGEMPASASNRGSQCLVQYLIETLEDHKEQLGLDCYSMNTATMERVFLSVIKNAETNEDTPSQKRKWWRW